MNAEHELLPPENYEHGQAELLNAQLMIYLRTRRGALAIEIKGDQFAAIVRLTVRPWVYSGISCNDFAVVIGPMFKSWADRFNIVETETLALRATLPEAVTFLNEWKSLAEDSSHVHVVFAARGDGGPGD